MRKCSIGETCNLIFEVLEPYRITRFQRNGTQRKSFEKFMRSGRKERNENMDNFNTRENVIEFIREDKQMTVTDPKGEFFVSNFLKKSQMDIKEKSFEKFMKSRRKERNE